MTTSTVTPEIARFAQGVRAALADLPADEVDDLTEGLEADLAEAYAEDLQRELPDPSAYAAELRLAAGLPVRSKSKAGILSAIGESLGDTRRDIGIAIGRNPTLSGIADFLVTLRPVWWVLRAWLALWLVAAFFGSEEGYWFGGTGWFFVLPVFVAISVQWGRGQWSAKRITPVILLGNVFAVLALLPVMAAADSYDNGYYDSYSEEPSESVGMTLDGASITNIFAYGADGKPLTNVQLFDQAGRPLVPHLDIYRDECADAECVYGADGSSPAPVLLETGASVRNVYPLSFVQGVIDEMGLVVAPSDPQAAPKAAEPPFLKVPAVMPLPEAVKK